MKKARFITIALALLLFLGCSTSRKLVEQEKTRDSVRTEIRYERIVTIDTCYVEIPAQSEKTITDERLSFLENDYAWSEASIDTLGLLHHSLATKPQKKPVPVQAVTEKKDSVIYKERYKYIEKPIKVPAELNWTQQAQIYGFRVMVALLALAIVVWKRKAIF